MTFVNGIRMGHDTSEVTRTTFVSSMSLWYFFKQKNDSRRKSSYQILVHVYKTGKILWKKKTIMACNNFTEQVYKILYLQTDRFGDFNTTIKNLFEGGLIMCFNFYVKVHQYMYMYNVCSCRSSMTYGHVFTLTFLYLFCCVFTEILRKNSAKIPC